MPLKIICPSVDFDSCQRVDMYVGLSVAEWRLSCFKDLFYASLIPRPETFTVTRSQAHRSYSV